MNNIINNGQNDDENSQAESNNFEPINDAQNGGQNGQNQNPNVNHYENVEVVQALGGVPAQNEANVAQIVNLQVNRAAQPVQQYHSAYRNDIYDRTGGYDIPRNARNQNYYANVPTNGTQRRSNLHLDIRPRCPPPNHQHSFDDTESCYYGSNYSTYERIRDEPVYQNSGNPLYGRLDVIGHGIGRIERHLSSSCGNIDHYNIGGHYAILNQSYVNPMMSNQGQIANPNAQTSKDAVKSLFSCLGGENSQSLNSVSDSSESNSNQPSTSNAQKSTGAIPKLKSKQTNKVSPKPESSESPKPNFSKSSLQYLVMNKWLPLPLGSDYKLIDFNFMFSRNCSTSGVSASDGVVQFNGQAEMVESGAYQPQAPREYPTMNNGHYPRVIRNVTPQLSRLRESEAENAQHAKDPNFRARSESPSFNGPRQSRQQEDPFRNWSFNFENNSFRPANGAVKRITDGTLAPKDYQEQNPKKEMPTVHVEGEEQPSTSKSSPSSENSNPTSSTSSNTFGKAGEMKKSENYDNLASLQQDPLPSTSDDGVKKCKKKSTESSDSVTLAEEDDDNDDPFDELESDID